MIKTRVFSNYIFFLGFLFCFTNDSISSIDIRDDSTDYLKDYSVKFIFGVAPGISSFSKLDFNSLSNRQPTILGGSFEFGCGYRNTKMIFRAGPLLKTMASLNEYDRNDSLEFSAQYHLVRQSIELSHAWYYNKSTKNRFWFEMTPLIGYDWFMRKYYGEVQNLKINNEAFDYHVRIVSNGIMFGSQVMSIYSFREKELRSRKDDFNYKNIDGPFFLFSYRRFEDIHQFTFEMGWISIDFAKMIRLQDFKIFGGIDEFRGTIGVRVYKIGFFAAVSPKRYSE